MALIVDNVLYAGGIASCQAFAGHVARAREQLRSSISNTSPDAKMIDVLFLAADEKFECLTSELQSANMGVSCFALSLSLCLSLALSLSSLVLVLVVLAHVGGHDVIVSQI